MDQGKNIWRDYILALSVRPEVMDRGAWWRWCFKLLHFLLLILILISVIAFDVRSSVCLACVRVFPFGEGRPTRDIGVTSQTPSQCWLFNLPTEIRRMLCLRTCSGFREVALYKCSVTLHNILPCLFPPASPRFLQTPLFLLFASSSGCNWYLLS